MMMIMIVLEVTKWITKVQSRWPNKNIFSDFTNSNNSSNNY